MLERILCVISEKVAFLGHFDVKFEPCTVRCANVFKNDQHVGHVAMALGPAKQERL